MDEVGGRSYRKVGAEGIVFAVLRILEYGRIVHGSGAVAIGIGGQGIGRRRRTQARFQPNVLIVPLPAILVAARHAQRKQTRNGHGEQ